MSTVTLSSHIEHPDVSQDLSDEVVAGSVSDAMLARMIDDLCLTASRGGTELFDLVDALRSLSRVQMGTPSVLARVVERMQVVRLDLAPVVLLLERRFGELDPADRALRSALAELNALTAQRLPSASEPT